MFRLFLVYSVLIIFWLVTPKNALAVTPPDFPSCVSPSGNLKTYYGSGIHGIPGNFDTHDGSDTIYQLGGNDQLLQCFCTTGGPDGIQTNWWKISSLTDDEIKILLNNGWILVPDGSAWGLDPVAYLAQNKSYACRSLDSGVRPTSSNQGGGGEAPASLQDVLGLAFTGEALSYYGTLVIGLGALLLGLVLIRLSKR